MRACKLTNDISKVIILNQSKINFMSDGKKNRKISSIQEYTVQVETIQLIPTHSLSYWYANIEN